MKKKILLGAAALAGIIIATCLVRAALFTSKQVAVEPATVEGVDARRIADNLSRALRLKTISYQDPAQFDGKTFLAFHRLLETAFPRVHKTLSKETVNNYSLLYTWKGSDPKRAPILLLGHIDVVPVETGTEKDWTHPPFSGAIADGYIWGRGALDIKVNVMGTLEAVEYLLARGYTPPQTIYLAFGHDEEVSGRNGAMKMAALLKARGVSLDYVLDEGGCVIEGAVAGLSAPAALIGIAEKGYLSLEFSVESEGGHSSMPPKQTAAGILCAAIAKLEKNQFPTRLEGAALEMFKYLGPEMSFTNRLVLGNMWLLGGVLKSMLLKSSSMAASIRTTTAPTMLKGSEKENVLPQKATAVVNYRILPGESMETVMKRAEKVIGDSRVKIRALEGGSDPSPISNTASTSFTVLQKTIHQIFPGAIVSPYLVLGATDSRYYTGVGANVYRFTPLSIKNEDLKRMHGTNERISVSNYEQAVKFFIQLIKNTGS
ncbi:MAG: M20 family peptidase [Spirochaetes bacterium]|jgi:carboxypeptidase PM20D1|nr:M20 family peptidase [Spirochaetota bacterium]